MQNEIAVKIFKKREINYVIKSLSKYFRKNVLQN